MARFFLPLILVAAAIGLFVVYTNPTYQSSKTVTAQVAQYQDALDKASELRKIRDDLLQKRAALTDDQVARLQHMLPDNVDSIRLIIDINNIAVRHGLKLADVKLGDISNSKTARSAAAVGNANDSVGSVEVGFSVLATYDTYLAFLQDLEHSLRIIDVTKIDFTSSQTSDLSPYSMTIRTYWLH